MSVQNILSRFTEVSEYWSPKIVAEINDSYVKIAKLKGEFVWHNHKDEEEMFLVVKGKLKLKFKDSELILRENDYYVVPKGLEHLPVADEECWVMLFEKKETKHTGDTISDLTKSINDQY